MVPILLECWGDFDGANRFGAPACGLGEEITVSLFLILGGITLISEMAWSLFLLSMINGNYLNGYT